MLRITSIFCICITSCIPLYRTLGTISQPFLRIMPAFVFRDSSLSFKVPDLACQDDVLREPYYVVLTAITGLILSP